MQVGQLAARYLGESFPDSGDILPWQIRTLESMQNIICEPDTPDLPRPDECGALEATLQFVRTMPNPTVDKMAALLSLFEFAPIGLGPIRTRFSRLPFPEQQGFLMSWPDSRIPAQRAAFHAIKLICTMGYWSREATWDAIGYSIDGNSGVPAHLKDIK